MDSAGDLFYVEDGGLVPLHEEGYEAESLLQEFLAKHPELLPGHAIDSDEPRRFVLIKREARVKNMEIDHLFIDQEAIPTLVEVKRASNREVRREVVAQMLDYASNIPGQWSKDQLEAWLAERVDEAPENGLEALDHDFDDDDDFWEQVMQNIRDGKVRLIFVADSIPASLRIVVEFLNERMIPTEVLAVEIKQYLASDSRRLLHSSLVGQTEKARTIKGSNKRSPIVPALIAAGKLSDGQDLWVLRKALPSHLVADIEDDDERLRFTLSIDDKGYGLHYSDLDTGNTEILSPSEARSRVRRALGDKDATRRTQVNDALATKPGGASLQEIANQSPDVDW